MAGEIKQGWAIQAKQKQKTRKPPQVLNLLVLWMKYNKLTIDRWMDKEDVVCACACVCVCVYTTDY